MRKVFIYSNTTKKSLNTKEKLCNILEKTGINITEQGENADITISIGGDGTFLEAFKASCFSNKPILGINTGHMGFFAEFNENELEYIADLCKNENYILQEHKTISCTVETERGIEKLDPAINDIEIIHGYSSIIHLNLFFGDTAIEKFSGDGILISSSAGSTAYNYSLGGSIIDPRMDLLQITPVAPANNNTYRSFTTSLIIPADQKIKVSPADSSDAVVVVDGKANAFDKIKMITVETSNNKVRIVRRPNYDFWDKVKSKFL